jgi:hypothetical protein
MTVPVFLDRQKDISCENTQGFSNFTPCVQESQPIFSTDSPMPPLGGFTWNVPKRLLTSMAQLVALPT